MVPQGNNAFPDKAKQYSTARYILSIVDTVYLVLLLCLVLSLGLSKTLAEALFRLGIHRFLVIPVFVAIACLAYYLLSFPFVVYGSFILEHRFSLSNQCFRDWLKDQFKAGIIAYLIAIILVAAFYYLAARFVHSWWLFVSLFWIFFNLILARVLPVIIIPLFFKYRQLRDEALRQRIRNLAEKMHVKILDCFEIDFSKKTLKANAAFVGWGSTRRIILADTLKDKYTYDEIEVILAHEFAHFKLNHLIKLLLLNSAATIMLFYLIFVTSGFALTVAGLPALADISALPLVLLYFVIFGIITQPFSNYISRIYEKNADREAVSVTGKVEAFISMMEKLATQNLADRNPHPVIEFFFFDHPPIDKRIAMVRSHSSR